MIEVIKAGAYCSVQDMGRRGFRNLGIGQGGALDTLALTIANHLVGNAADCAGIEITVGPVEFRFQRDGWIALSGADFGATLDGKAIWPGWRTAVSAGQRLRLVGPRQGMRAYLAVNGGIAVESVLNSRSTDFGAGFGGGVGRALRAGDILPLGSPQALDGRKGVLLPVPDSIIRALPGPEYEQFSAESQQQLWSGEWKVTAQSNRMGYRLQGEALTRLEQKDLQSHGVLPGVVQVPPNGQPIVLMADAQTTGGYPRIAVVIEADLWKLAQVRLGGSLQLRMCDQQQATAARREHGYYLYQLKWSLHAS